MTSTLEKLLAITEHTSDKLSAITGHKIASFAASYRDAGVSLALGIVTQGILDALMTLFSPQ